MISINGNDSRQSKVPRDRREIVGRQSPVRGDGPFFLVASAAAEPLDARLSASPQSAMIYFLSSSFLFSLRELTHLRSDISPFPGPLIRLRRSSPPFHLWSSRRTRATVTNGRREGLRGDEERRKGDFRSANIVSLLMNFSVR